MDSLPTPGSPIYDQLVREHGDVLAEARKLADQALLEADPAQFWGRTPMRHRVPEEVRAG
ncbi:hypothetical protein OG204_30405 [Streptomyces sp. NBC_01387]|uniref:hypothetical protein n=1 Tax=unclassified Streptomyces TaxID=2593676 RepID=UPI002024E4EB|nr:MULTISPECIES: hypothetical protein [unclassified Streptomyces]MCX4547323.1 hypothetical protein [Streptomyces sp. NBC_01500]WSC19049.1 hypothetical protein OIE60_04865 [Streptomyces sp. NBC_01766]WSV53073.1 hypothetical protein OG282_04815 [Streptomyces sp. NBC_01014]